MTEVEKIRGQELVFTVWSNSEWLVWGAMDAFYAQADPDYLITIPLRNIYEARQREVGKEE